MSGRSWVLNQYHLPSLCFNDQLRQALIYCMCSMGRGHGRLGNGWGGDKCFTSFILLHNKLPQIQWLKTPFIYNLHLPWVRSPDMAYLGSVLRNSQGWNEVTDGVVFLSGARVFLWAFEVVGRVQILGIVGLKSPFSCWLTIAGDTLSSSVPLPYLAM